MKSTRYNKQMDMLEAAIKVKEARKRKHEPFVFYQPWSITLDEYYVKYYPEGLFKKPQVFGPVGYGEACVLLQKFPGKLQCQISMGECSEWLLMLHHFSDHSLLYTQEQRERLMKKELEEHPELEYILTDESAEMRETLLKLPQVFFVSVKDLQQAIKEE